MAVTDTSRVVSAAVAISVLSASWVAHGEEPVRIAYKAPVSCPTKADFIARLQARKVPFTPAVAGTVARAFQITISEVGDRFAATALVFDPRTGLAERWDAPVSDTDCRNVFELLRRFVETTILERSAPTSTPPSPRWQWRFSGLGLRTTATYHMAPEVTGAVSVFGEFGPFRAGRQVFGMRLSAAYSRWRTEEPGQAVAFTWALGRLDVCRAIRVAGGFHLLPCLGLEAGWLAADSDDVVAFESAGALWLAPGGNLRLRRGIGRYFVEVDAGASVWLSRGDFRVFDDTVLRGFLLSGRIAVAVGRRFF